MEILLSHSYLRITSNWKNLDIQCYIFAAANGYSYWQELVHIDKDFIVRENLFQNYSISGILSALNPVLIVNKQHILIM